MEKEKNYIESRKRTVERALSIISSLVIPGKLIKLPQKKKKKK